MTHYNAPEEPRAEDEGIPLTAESGHCPNPPCAEVGPFRYCPIKGCGWMEDDGPSETDVIERVLREHLPVELPDNDAVSPGKTMCLHTVDEPRIFDGPVQHRQHVARLIVEALRAR